jgi:membrane-associated phospholipid phosphatase
VPELTTTPAGLPVPPWLAEMGRRFAHLQWLKLIGITAFMWLFFVGYFHVLRHPVNPLTTMPLTALDRWLPFTPQALWVYVSLWFYIGIPPGLMPGFRPLVVHGLWAAALCAVGLAFFYFFPTAVPARPLEVPAGSAFAVLQGVDAPGNACPSLHVATAMFSAGWIDRMLREVQAPRALRWLNAAWFVAIAWSTMATRQHVLLDVIGGLALGALFAIPSLTRRKPR